jgi:hypothetical protein
MADPVLVSTRPTTRNKLAQFLQSPELIRMVENLTQDVGTTLPQNIDVAAAAAGAASAAAEGAAGIADAAQATANSAQSNLNSHITDPVDAHDASAISYVPTGSIAATDVQGALNELDAELTAFIASLGTLSTQNANAVAITGGTVLLASGSLGYAAGNGGTVTQATSKATGVALDKVSGEITLNAAALAAGAAVTFTLNNFTIAAADRIILNHKSGGTFMAYALDAQPAAGSALIGVRNLTAGALSEAIVIGFTVIKSTAT